jgi:hypothetical protein
VDEITTDFFNKWYSYDHYSMLKPRPNKFLNWKNDQGLTRDYFNWIEKESNCPSLKLDILVPHEEMEKEATALMDEFVKHRGEEHPGWHSLVIHGFDKHTTDDWTSKAYSFKEKPEYTWTEIADACPITKKWLQEVWDYTRFDRVRFMLLLPGGCIKPHADYETRKLAAYNVAINNPDGVEFVMEDAGLIPWKPGDARAIDIGRRHSVRHIGNKPRIHMIIHGAPGFKHIKTVCRSYDLLLDELYEHK